MIAFILRRLLLMIPTTIGVALVIFSLYHVAPGDPALIAVGSQADSTAGGGGDGESRIDQFRRENGLDRHFFVQFFDYIGPFNLGPDGHRWFSSPRTERKTDEVEVEGRDEPVLQGQPVEIEPLASVTDDERDTLATLVGALRLGGDESARAEDAAVEMLAYARASDEAMAEARAALFNGLFELKIGGSKEAEGVERIDAVLQELTGFRIQENPAYYDAKLFEIEGVKHTIKSWLGWYYTEGGGYRTQNTGVKPFDGLLAGDLGLEMQSKASVAKELWSRLQVTVPLSLV
ncbi:MAG: hypothetical protein AAGG01_11330, partial [Planctomycetota bacterium]